jgi:hypothetical protein
MEVGSTTFWLLLIAVVWVLVIASILVMGWWNAAARKREQEMRPTYELGDSIQSWQMACEQSLEWSLARRNGTKVKKEVQ